MSNKIDIEGYQFSVTEEGGDIDIHVKGSISGLSAMLSMAMGKAQDISNNEPFGVSV